MDNIINIFKALSDETRIRILKLLEAGELCVCDIVAALDIVQPKISFHLKILKNAELLRDRKEGKWMHYSLNESDMFKRFLLMSVFERLPNNLFDGDKKRLSEFLKKKSQGLINVDMMCNSCKNKKRGSINER